MKELTILAAIENIPEVTAFVDAELEEAGCPIKVQFQIDVAVDEIFTNIAMYAYAPGTGSATVRIEVDRNEKVAEITFIDSGVAFNPLLQKEPDTTLPAAQRAVGGLGIFMVKKSMDEMHYAREGEQNILRIRKSIR